VLPYVNESVYSVFCIYVLPTSVINDDDDDDDDDRNMCYG